MSMTLKDFQTIAEHIHNALDNDTDIMEGLLRSFEAINPAFSREKFIKEAIPEKYFARQRVVSKINLDDKDGCGEYGSVVCTDGPWILVEFDRRVIVGMHDGGIKASPKGANGYCWWMQEDDVEYV